MSSAALDRLLAILLVTQLVSGLLTLRSGVPATAPLFWFHGLVGGALLVAAIEKVRRSIGPAVRARRWRRLALGALLSLLVAGALVGGFAWVAGGRILSIGPWTVLTIHVWFALAAVPVVLFHLLPRRWRLLRPRSVGQARTEPPHVPRRAPGVVVLGAAAWGASNLLDRIQAGSSPLHRLAMAAGRRHPSADDLLRRGHADGRPRRLAPAGHGTRGASADAGPRRPRGARHGRARRGARLHLGLGAAHRPGAARRCAPSSTRPAPMPQRRSSASNPSPAGTRSSSVASWTMRSSRRTSPASRCRRPTGRRAASSRHSGAGWTGSSGWHRSRSRDGLALDPSRGSTRG